MAAKEANRKPTKATPADRPRAPKDRPGFYVERLSDGRCRVGSEIGLTLPIGDNTTAHLRFSFWSERLSKNDSMDELKRTAALVDEFNEAELERRVRKYQRLIKRTLEEDEEEDEGYGSRTRAANRRRSTARRR